jgi:hypothetical protein
MFAHLKFALDKYMEVNGYINFLVDEEKQISNRLVESLESFKDKLLWRKSKKGADDHFILKKNEKEISLFLQENENENENDLDDTGLNFLVFFFCYPAKQPFCRRDDWIRESVAVSLSPKILRTKLLTAAETLIPKFDVIKISERQKYDRATHCELIFSKDKDGTFYDLDPEVLAVLKESSQINPEKQEKEFMDEIFRICGTFFAESTT